MFSPALTKAASVYGRVEKTPLSTRERSKVFLRLLGVIDEFFCLTCSLIARTMAPIHLELMRPINHPGLRKTLCVLTLAIASSTWAAEPSANNSQKGDPVDQIREEGLERSQAMETLTYLSDVIGPRLTGSPGMMRANQWTLEKLLGWGLKNARMEPWFFGRGWSVERFSAQVVKPYQFPLIGAPKAWSGGFEKPIEAEVVWLEGGSRDLEKYRGQLKGKIVLISQIRGVQPRFEPLALRMSETNLLRLANAPAPAQGFAASRSEYGPGDRPMPPRTGTNTSSRTQGSGGSSSPMRLLPFLAEEGAALAVSCSSMGDGGTFFVTSAMATPPSSGGTNIAMPTRLWATNSPAILPQITLAVEDYNRLVRMIQCGEKPVMAVDLRVQYQTEDLMAYNTVAEIPGTDLKDEVVMVGGHLDSWHIGTGATDNAVGVTAAMEAVRIIKALDLKPRRTIRIGLWSGEEQGLLGSKAYVSQHFGSLTNRAISERIAAPKDESDEESSQPRRQERVRRTRVVKQKEYDKLSAYFNLDNGAGKIRGIHLQGNEALRPIFREWLQPFSDLGASTISASNTGGTDHTSFDAIGLPGFQFIQDPLEYWSRTHHANQDVLERIVPDDLKQAATILAAFAYQAAMEEERLPRKPAP